LIELWHAEQTARGLSAGFREPGKVDPFAGMVNATGSDSSLGSDSIPQERDIERHHVNPPDVAFLLLGV